MYTYMSTREHMLYNVYIAYICLWLVYKTSHINSHAVQSYSTWPYSCREGGGGQKEHFKRTNLFNSGISRAMFKLNIKKTLFFFFKNMYHLLYV